MDAQFSQRIKDVLGYSKEEAVRLGNSHISVEHLFLGILRDGEGLAIDVLVVLGVELYDLRMAVEKMDEHFHVKVETHIPTVPYRETIAGSAEGHHRHKKQTGGAGQFDVCPCGHGPSRLGQP